MKKNVCKTNKKKLLKLINTLVIFLVLVTAYALSVYTSSFKEANLKLLSLFFYALFGFIGFYIVYAVAYLITMCTQIKNRKKQAIDIVECDEQLNQIFSDNKNKFKYNPKCNVAVNFNIYKDQVLSVIKQIAEGFNKAKSEYYYLSYTVYDALDIVDNVINGVDAKVSPIFGLLKAEDKPLKVVEKLLVSAVEKENAESVEKTQNSFIKSIADKLLSAGLMVFRKTLENTANDLIVFIGFEAFKAYNKNGAKYLPVIKKEDENA